MCIYYSNQPSYLACTIRQRSSLRPFSTHTMLSKFTLALFTLALSAFFGSATVPEDYGQLPEDTGVAITAGQGDNYLASFLVPNNSDSGTHSHFRKRSHVALRRRNTPELGGSGKVVCDHFPFYPGSFFLHQFKGIVVPLSKVATRTRYIGTIHVGEAQLRKKFDVAFGTAAFDLAVFTQMVPASSSDKKSQKGAQNRYSEVLSGLIWVNLFDGFGTGVACRDTIEVGGISRKSEIFGTLQNTKGFKRRYLAQG